METTEKDILRGGQFLVKETACEDVFTPEDFSEEQVMMKEAVKEFNEREIIANRDRFESKDYSQARTQLTQITSHDFSANASSLGHLLASAANCLTHLLVSASSLSSSLSQQLVSASSVSSIGKTRGIAIQTAAKFIPIRFYSML